MRPLPPLTKAVLLAVPAVTFYCVACSLIVAAPRGRPEPPPPPKLSRVVGWWKVQTNCEPTVMVGPRRGEVPVYVVFPLAEMRDRAVLDHREGDPVVAVGRVGTTGPYHYVYVERLETP